MTLGGWGRAGLQGVYNRDPGPGEASAAPGDGCAEVGFLKAVGLRKASLFEVCFF